MSTNDLLIWMSARVEGSWQQFRSAVERFHVEDEAGENDDLGDDPAAGDLPLYQSIRFALERLAHAEFALAERRWRIVPPCLAANPKGDRWVGILCGARSPSLNAHLGQLPATVSFYSDSKPGMPDRVRLEAPDFGALSLASAALGLAIQSTAPATLLAAVPAVDDPRSRFPADPPTTPGWTIHRFSANNLQWEGTDLQQMRSANTDLFRFQLRYQRQHYLRWRGRTFRVPVQVGKYAVLRRRRRARRVVLYDRARAVLSVPVTCRPPLLIERALVLCSGALPELGPDVRRLEFGEVPPDIARMAAAALCQGVEIR